MSQGAWRGGVVRAGGWGARTKSDGHPVMSYTSHVTTASCVGAMNNHGVMIAAKMNPAKGDR